MPLCYLLDILNCLFLCEEDDLLDYIPKSEDFEPLLADRSDIVDPLDKRLGDPLDVFLVVVLVVSESATKSKKIITKEIRFANFYRPC